MDRGFVFIINFSEKIGADVYQSVLYFGGAGLDRDTMHDIVTVVQKKSVRHALLQNVLDPEEVKALEQQYTVFSTVDELHECAGEEISSPQWQKIVEKFHKILERQDTRLTKSIASLEERSMEFPENHPLQQKFISQIKQLKEKYGVRPCVKNRTSLEFYDYNSWYDHRHDFDFQDS